MRAPSDPRPSSSVKRVRSLYTALVVIVAIFIVRLFYVQVLHYNYYHAAALSDQLKQYEIPPTRGIIEAYQGSEVVPLVLNQTLYTLYADPPLIKNISNDASIISSVIGGSANQYKTLMSTRGTEYVVLANQITASESSKILSHQFPGVGTQGRSYRVYPDGSLASQVLGFVNNSAQGEYGIEQALNKELTGTPGELKAITDANGVPLVAISKNIRTPAVPGDTVVTTLDMGMQYQMEQILQKDYQSTKSQLLSAIIMDPYTGQIKAMANYPTYNPANYSSTTNPSVFQNAAVSNDIEPGSTMKIMTTSAALDLGVIQPNSSFYDPAQWVIDGFKITDIEQDGGPRVQNIASVLNLSLNTGATWMLMQMGGGQIDQKGIDAWHEYMVNHFLLGQPTGIEQGYEAAGIVPAPDINDPSIDLTYANTAFGQGVTVTALQMAAADSSILNGGTYYKPTLVSETITPSGKTIPNNPKVVRTDTVAPKVGQEMIPLMEYVVQQHLLDGFPYMNFPSNYIVGGKTGTAQIAQPGGGYYANKYNGTYIGFVGGDKVQYVIVVYNIQPGVPGYAGTYGGQPVFADLAHMLINDAYVTPKT
ncbi:MAG TPA: penicillin-binding protein 2 [Candidatus Saccharimonadales bacterium]|nr:penicillin-binding protein 2 [Candidatus Saccharimonadales bacterium]